MIPLLLTEGFRSLMTQVSFLHYGGYWMKLPWSNAEWENRTSLSSRCIEMGFQRMSRIRKTLVSFLTRGKLEGCRCQISSRWCLIWKESLGKSGVEYDLKGPSCSFGRVEDCWLTRRSVPLKPRSLFLVPHFDVVNVRFLQTAQMCVPFGPVRGF
jgi:hypothetical protein